MKQAGLSLVEVMISALISIVIIQGFFQMFFSNLMTSNYHETRSLAQTRAQFALYMIGNDVREAGTGAGMVGPGSYNIFINKQFSSTSSRKTNQGLGACQNFCDTNSSCKGFSWANGFVSSGTGSGDCKLSYSSTNRRDGYGWITYQKVDNTVFYSGYCGGVTCTQEGGGNRSDSIAIVLDPNHNQDCTGRGISGLVINRYFIVRDSDGHNALYCQSFNYPSGSSRGSRQLMVEGVEQLQLLYGYADSGGLAATSYRTASSITNWGFVRTVQIGLLVGGGNLWGSKVKQSRRYNLLGSSTLILVDKEPRYPFTMVQSLFSTREDTSWREKEFFEAD